MKAGWQTKTLGNICDILDNRRKPITKCDRKPGPYPYYGATGILDYVDGYLFDEPLILVGEDGAKWASGDNTAFAVEGKCWVNNHAHVLRPHRSVLLDNWLIHFLVHSDLSEFVSGLTVPKLNQGSLREISLPVPPLLEQQRIVALLDEAFDGIATAKSNAEKNLQNARAIFESHLQLVFTQRGDGWADRSLGGVAVFRNGINFTKSSVGVPIKILGVKDFRNSYWAPLEDLETVIPDGSLGDLDMLQKDDLVFVRSNGNPELIGRCLLVGDVTEKTTHSGFTIRARLSGSELIPRYLCHFLKSNLVRREMIDGGNGANIRSLNQGTLSRLVIPVPPTRAQVQIVSQLEEVDGETKRLESIYQRKLTAFDELKRSLLQHAFSGAL